MMMDYMKEVKQSMTSSEFRDGMIIDQFEINSELIFLVLKIVLLMITTLFRQKIFFMI